MKLGETWQRFSLQALCLWWVYTLNQILKYKICGKTDYVTLTCSNAFNFNVYFRVTTPLNDLHEQEL